MLPLAVDRVGYEQWPVIRHWIHPTIGRDLVAMGVMCDRTAKRSDRRPEPLDIAARLGEIETSWHGLLAKDGRLLSVRADSGHRSVPASAAAVRQILAVLADNAVHHGTGRVDVHDRDTIGSIAVDVRDQGSVDVDEAVFASSAATGHGIGLPLARSLAEAEGARLLITRRKPTTFTLFLPEAD